MIDILEALRDLRAITATPGRGCTRLAFTEQENQAHDYIWQRLQSIRGLSRIDDAAGNMFIVPQDAVPQGTAVVLLGSHLDTVIEAYHLCMMMRGVEKQNSKTVTSALRGLFRDDAKARDEFLRLAHGGRWLD